MDLAFHPCVCRSMMSLRRACGSSISAISLRGSGAACQNQLNRPGGRTMIEFDKTDGRNLIRTQRWILRVQVDNFLPHIWGQFSFVCFRDRRRGCWGKQGRHARLVKQIRMIVDRPGGDACLIGSLFGGYAKKKHSKILSQWIGQIYVTTHIVRFSAGKERCPLKERRSTAIPGASSTIQPRFSRRLPKSVGRVDGPINQVIGTWCVVSRVSLSSKDSPP
jgi:hypothetical protein